MPAPDPAFHVLAPGDAVVPSVLHGTQRIPVPGTDGALPPPTAPTVAQRYAASARADLPAWMSALPGYVVAELTALFADLGPIGAPTAYAFDPFHRTDDRTVLGKPAGGRIPVLGVRLPDALLSDPTGTAPVLHLRKFREGDRAYEESFSVEVRDLAAFGPPWSDDVHAPALVLEERWRLVSLEAETCVGALAGTLTLLPGERRTVKISASSEHKSASTATRSIVEDAAEATKDDFAAEFARNGRSTRKSSSRVTWTVAPPGRDLPSPHAREQAFSVEEVVEVAEKATRQTTQARKTGTKVTVSRDDERVDTTKVEGARTLEISNPSAQCLTLAYHHLNTAYRTHVDLVELRLVYTGGDAGAEPVAVDLGEGLAAFLRGVAGGDAAAAQVHAALVALLDERYASLGVGQVVGGRFVFESPPTDDPNDRLDSRAALLGLRRRTGALPLCLSSRTHVLQRDTLHAVPHLSEFAIPGATGVKPKALEPPGAIP